MSEEKRTPDSLEDKALNDMTNDFGDIFSEIKEKNDTTSEENQPEQESAIRGIFGRIKKKKSHQSDFAFNAEAESTKKTSSMKLSESQEILDLSQKVTESVKKEAVVIVKAEEESSGVTTITMKIPKLTDEKLAEIEKEKKQADKSEQSAEEKIEDKKSQEQEVQKQEEVDEIENIGDILKKSESVKEKTEIPVEKGEVSEDDSDDLPQDMDEKPSFKTRFSKFLSTAKEKALYYLGFEDDEEYEDDVIFSTSSGVERTKNANPLDFDEEYKENIVYQAPAEEKKDDKPDLLKVAAQNTTINQDFNLFDDASDEPIVKTEVSDKTVTTESKTEVSDKTVTTESKTEVSDKTVTTESKTEVSDKTAVTESKTEVSDKTVTTESKTEVSDKTAATESKTEVTDKTITDEIKKEDKSYPKENDSEDLTFEEILAKEKRNRISIDIALDDGDSVDDTADSPLSDQLDFSILAEQIAGDVLRESRKSKKSASRYEQKFGNPQIHEKAKLTEAEVKSEEAVKPTEEEVKSEEAVKPTEAEVKSEQAAKPTKEEVKSEEAAKPTEEEVKSEEAAKPTEEEVKSEEAVKSAGEEVKSEEAVKPTEEEVKSEEAAKPTEEEVKSEEAAKPTEEEVKSEEAAKPTEEEVKSEEAAKPTEEEVKSEEAVKPTEEEVKSEEAVKPTEEESKVEDDKIKFEDIAVQIKAEVNTEKTVDSIKTEVESQFDNDFDSPFIQVIDISKRKRPKQKPIEQQAVDEAKSEPIEQPAVDEAKSEPIEQPAVDEAKSEPIEQPAVDEAKSEPIEQPVVNEAKSEPIEQPAVDEAKPEPIEQPAVDEAKPEPIEQPVVNEAKTEPIEQPVVDEAKPEPIEQPVVDEAKPEPIEQPVVDEAKPKPIEQPAVNEAKPKPIEQPAVNEANSEPIEQQAVDEAKPEPIEQPVVDEAKPESKQLDGVNPFIKIVDKTQTKPSITANKEKPFNPVIMKPEKPIQEFKLDFAKEYQDVPKTMLTYKRPSERSNFIVMAGKFTKTVRSEYRAYRYKPKPPEPPTPPDIKQNSPTDEQPKPQDKNDENGKTSFLSDFSFKKRKKKSESEQQTITHNEPQQKNEPQLVPQNEPKQKMEQQSEQKNASVVKPVHKQSAQPAKFDKKSTVKPQKSDDEVKIKPPKPPIPKPKIPTVPPAVKAVIPTFMHKKQRPEIMPDIKEKEESIPPKPEKTVTKPSNEKKKQSRASEARKAIKKKTQTLKLFSSDEDLDTDDFELNEENREIEEYSSKNDEKEIRSEINNNYRKLTLRSIIIAIGLVLSITLDILVGVISETFLSMPFGWLLIAFLNAIILCACVVSCYVPIINGIVPLRHFKANSDTSLAVASFAGILQAFISFFTPESFINGHLHYYTTLVILGLLLNCIGRMLIIIRVHDNFKFIMKNSELYAGKIYTDERNAKKMFTGAPLNKPLIAYRKKTKFLSNFLQLSYAPDPSENMASKIAPITSVVALAAALIYAFVGGGVAEGTSAFVLFAIILTPICQLIAVNLPIKRLCSAVVKKGSMVTSYESVKQFCDTNAIIVDSNDLYPSGTVTMSGIKTFSGSKVDDAIRGAAAVMLAVKAPMSNMFDNIIKSKRDTLPHVESVIYEDGLGLVGWVAGQRILLGNRRLLETHEIKVPPVEYEKKYTDKSKQAVYLSLGGELVAMFIVTYKGNSAIAEELRDLEQNGVTLLVRTIDSNITQDRIAEDFGVFYRSVKILPTGLGNITKEMTDTPDEETRAYIATKGGIQSFARAISGCIRIKSNVTLSIFLQIAGIILGFVLVGVITFISGIARLNILELLILYAFCILVGIVAPIIPKP